MSPWLAAAYGALVLGLGWMLAGGSSWKWRAAYVVLAPALALALWLDRPDAAGWPTPAGLPKNSMLQWAVVREPDPATADRGRIYLWLDVGAAAPRAYSLPYTRRTEEQVQHALAAVKDGRPMAVGRAQTGHGRGRPSGAPGQRSIVRFYARPPVRLPPKTSG